MRETSDNNDNVSTKHGRRRSCLHLRTCLHIFAWSNAGFAITDFMHAKLQGEVAYAQSMRFDVFQKETTMS